MQVSLVFMENLPVDSIDPRVVRTRRDVVGATTALFLAEGWTAVTHAEVARRAGYSKATIYSHWPTCLDLVRASVEQICVAAKHPLPTGDLRTDLVRELVTFADALSRGHLDRVLGGILERAGSDPRVDELRKQLYEAETLPAGSNTAGPLTFGRVGGAITCTSRRGCSGQSRVRGKPSNERLHRRLD